MDVVELEIVLLCRHLILDYLVEYLCSISLLALTTFGKSDFASHFR
jgi:hypothetical protein